MSKLIRQLLGETDARFSHSLTRLEFAAGNPGIDTRLTAEILSTTRAKVASLGLDPSDTTGAELYRGLEQKLVESEADLRAYLGHPANIDEGAKRVAALASTIIGNRETWAIKHSVLRTILKNNPPKKVMKLFHYQSADSMARRMHPGEVLIAARLLESKTWWNKTKKLYGALSSADFEKKQLEVIYLADARWLAIMSDYSKQQGVSAIGVKEFACVGYVPVEGACTYMSLVPHLLHTCNEVMVYGSFLKLHFVNPSIGTVLVHALDDGEMVHTSIAGAAIHWRDVRRHFGILVAEGERSIAHLDMHDLGWMTIEAQLSLLVPSLSYWMGLDICGVSYGDSRVVSCNMLDVAKSITLGHNHASMSLTSLQRSLRSELMARYLAAPTARALALKQFDFSANIEENW
jgi:hypothetical protein